jgi:hypothetical protein
MTKDTGSVASPAANASDPADVVEDGDAMSAAPEEVSPMAPASRSTTEPPVIGNSVATQSTAADASAAASSSTANSIAKDQPTGTTASPYGTRSRNRTGTSRPNYAEDKEMDMEFEYQSKDEGPRKAARGQAVESNPPETARSTPAGRRPPTVDALHNTLNASKEPIPGTSSFSAVPTSNSAAASVPPSKKRKANPSASTAGSQLATSVTGSAADAQMSGRSEVTMASNLNGVKYTNLMTFENCGAILEAGKLVADDGTVLEVNGTSRKIFIWLLFKVAFLSLPLRCSSPFSPVDCCEAINHLMRSCVSPVITFY